MCEGGAQNCFRPGDTERTEMGKDARGERVGALPADLKFGQYTSNRDLAGG